MEENDKVKFKEQLQIVGNFGRQVSNHSLPLLAQLLEDRILKLRDNVNALIASNGAVPEPNPMNDLYEDLHWLVLIAGHVLCMESGGEAALIPLEIRRRSMDQSREGNVDVNRTLEFLVSSQNVQSDIISPAASIDRIIRLITCIFRLCALKKDTKNRNIYTNAILPQNMTSCLATIDIFLGQPYPVLSSMVIPENSINNTDKIDFDQIIRNILGIKNVHSMIFDDKFERLGIDSLAYMEIKQILERDCNIILSFRELRALTINKLKNLLKL